MAWCARRVGPRRIDPDQAARVTEKTLEVYRSAGLRFSTWALQRGLRPSGADEWDDLLVEFKNDQIEYLTPAKFVNTVASVEFFFPRMRGRLLWSKAVIAGWERNVGRKHTVPLGKLPGKLLGVHIAAKGNPRLGLALIVQCHAGMRPPELLGILPEDLIFPRDLGDNVDIASVSIALGARTGTKLKRPQVVRIFQEDRDIMEVLQDITRATPAGTPLFPYSLVQHRRALKDTEGSLGLSMGRGPHSPRAGWASDSKAEGLSFEEVRERGRWNSDGSLRIYLDIVGASHILTQLNTKGFAQQLYWLKRGWRQYFPPFVWGALRLPEHGTQGLCQ